MPVCPEGDMHACIMHTVQHVSVVVRCMDCRKCCASLNGLVQLARPWQAGLADQPLIMCMVSDIVC